MKTPGIRFRFQMMLFAFACCGITVSSAQLTYLGPDKQARGAEPYRALTLSGGIVAFDNAFYYTTPTGKLFRTDGTEAGTRCVHTAEGHALPIIAATAGFLYLGLQEPPYVAYMHRFRPGNSKLEALRLEDPDRPFRFNLVRVPGYNQRSDDYAVAPDRKRIVFRNFADDAMTLNVVADDAPARTRMVKRSSPAEIADRDVSIYPSTDIGFVRNEIFVNGHERDLLTTTIGTDAKGLPKALRTGPWAFTASSVRKTPGDATTYYIDGYYFLESKGYTLYKGLLQCGTQLYSHVSKAAGKAVGEHQLVRFDSAKLSLSNAKLPGGSYYTAEVHDGQIYLITTGGIYRYDAQGDVFKRVYHSEGLGLNQLFDMDMLVKCGHYLLARAGTRLLLIDERTGTAIDFKGIKPFEEPNRFSFGDRYAWATKQHLYLLDEVDGRRVFTRYAPATRSFRAIPMPAIDKSTFEGFRAIFQLDDRFLLLTEYRDRKGKTIYQMFMYREETA